MVVNVIPRFVSHTLTTPNYSDTIILRKVIDKSFLVCSLPLNNPHPVFTKSLYPLLLPLLSGLSSPIQPFWSLCPAWASRSVIFIVHTLVAILLVVFNPFTLDCSRCNDYQNCNSTFTVSSLYLTLANPFTVLLGHFHATPVVERSHTIKSCAVTLETRLYERVSILKEVYPRDTLKVLWDFF